MNLQKPGRVKLMITIHRARDSRLCVRVRLTDINISAEAREQLLVGQTTYSEYLKIQHKAKHNSVSQRSRRLGARPRKTGDGGVKTTTEQWAGRRHDGYQKTELKWNLLLIKGGRRKKDRKGLR